MEYTYQFGKVHVFCRSCKAEGKGTTDRAEDRAGAAGLPGRWAPRRAGPLLAKHLKKTHRQYQATLQSLTDNATNINAVIDAKVRTLAENISSFIQQSQTQINCIVEDCQSIENQLTRASRNAALDNVKHVLSQRVEEIAKFKHEGVLLEKERADHLRRILRDHFERLVAIGHKAPKDLLHDFDVRVYEANQQLLSNYRAYVNLEARLQVQADASELRARSSLNQFCLGVQVNIRQRSVEQFPRRISGSQVSFSSPNAGKRISLFPSITYFNECVGLIKEAYEHDLLKMFNSFSVKFKELREDLGKCIKEEITTGVFKSPELRHEDDLLRRLSVCINNELPPSTDALNLIKNIEQLESDLQTTFNLFNDASHLWDAHIQRTALAEKLTVAAVEHLATNNDSDELANEILIGIALEQLRTSHSLDNLQDSYNNLIELLDKTAELYLHHSEKELKRFEDFMNMSALMTDILLAEFNNFVKQYRGNKVLPMNNFTEEQHTMDSERDRVTALPLPRILFKSKHQAEALQKWRNDFLESFQNNYSFVSDKLKLQAHSWVQKKNAIVNARYTSKMLSHRIRKERVEAAKETRVAELQFHEERLGSHLDAIYKLTMSLPAEASQYLSLDAPFLYPFCDRIDTVQAKVDEVRSREPPDPKGVNLMISSYFPRMRKYRALFEVSLDEAIEKQKERVENQLQEARISNVRFMCAVKLFGEGGSYSSQEAMRAVAALDQATDALERCLCMTLDALAKRRSYLSHTADRLLALLLPTIPIGRSSKRGVHVSGASNLASQKSKKKR